MPKLIVDSSVWIDFFNKKTSPQIVHLKMLLLMSLEDSPIIILPVIMQEVLQGVEDDKFYNLIKENLNGLDFFQYESYGFSIKAAELYRALRHKGVTIKKANDCLIAASCIENDIPIFHNDKDFDNIAKHTSLKIYKR
ncbi:MAG: type II toxin-antitoxin system VapC family toxin [Ginsengibacter sp.]